jgi:NADH:ubiquinone oxidoreductase subunit H
MEYFIAKLIKYGLFINTILAQLIIFTLIKLICILIAVAYFTIAERKAMAAIQRRKGPNVVGFWGLLQPLADGAKLLFKELLIPTRANTIIFLMAPLMVLILSIVGWTIIPGVPQYSNEISFVKSYTDSLINAMNSFSMHTNTNYCLRQIYMFENNLWGLIKSIKWIFDFFFYNHFTNTISWIVNAANISYGLLFILVISGLNVYGIIISGWASNSKYAFLGALRSSAQMISYEVSLSLLILPVILLAGSLNFGEIVIAQQKFGWFVFPLLPCTILFFISMLAETNRAPFDLPEAEAELVAGYNVEYSSIIFAMFFLGEYSNMLLMSTILVLLFFGGWLPILNYFTLLSGYFYFSIKVIFIAFLFILVRAALPRYRYDQLMDLGWKTYLPFSLAFLVFVIGLLITYSGLVYNINTWNISYSENNFFL